MEIINIKEFSSFSSSPVFKPVLDNPHTKTQMICLKKGQVLTNHRCHCDEALIVCLQGTVLIYDGQTPNTLEHGSLVIIEKNIDHKIEATQDTVLLFVQSPNPKSPRKI